MAAKVASVLLALGASAFAAIEDDFPTPFNAQIGALRFPITCKAFGIPLDVDGVYTGTAPVYAFPGQPVSVTDVTATITVPKILNQLAAGIGLERADALVFININAANTVQKTAVAFPDGLWVNNTRFVKGGDFKITFPPTGVLPPIGNFVSNDVGKTATFSVGKVTAKLYLYTKSGKLLLNRSIDVTCDEDPTPISIGGYNIAGPFNSTPFRPANGFKPNYPALTPLQEIGYFRQPYICDIGQFKNIATELFFGGILFGQYASGGTFSLPNITAVLSVPQTLLDAARVLYNAQSFETTVTDVQIGLSNASPSSQNILKAPVKYVNQYPTSGGFKITLPSTGTITAGPFKAGPAVNSYMTLSIGKSVASLVVKAADGSVKATLPVSCGPQYGKLDVYDILIGPVGS